MNKEDTLTVQHLQAQIDRLTVDDRVERQRQIWQHVLESMNHRQRDSMLDRISEAKAAGRKVVLDADKRRKTGFE